MKLAYLTPANSSHSRRWLRHFEAQGHAILWISLHQADPDLVSDLSRNVTFVDLHRSPNPWSLWGQAREARQLVRTFGADVLHVHSMGRYGLVGTLIDLPTVTTAWGSDVVDAGPLRRILLRRMIRRSVALTCDAEHLKRRLIALGADPDNIHIIYFGVELNEFDALPDAERSALRREMEVGDAPAIVSLRSLEPLYDVATLIRAIPRVSVEVPEVVCLIVSDGSERDRLHALAAELGVDDRVRFLGRRPVEDVRQLLQISDVYVSTALSDGGLAASTAEAMATRLPVIVSDSAENSIWISPGVNGWLFPPGNHDRLADLLIDTIRRKDMARQLAAAARSTIEERNNVAVEMARAEMVLREAIAR